MRLSPRRRADEKIAAAGRQMALAMRQAREQGDEFDRLRRAHYHASRPWWKPARFDSYERAWRKWTRRFSQAGRRAHTDMAMTHGKPWSNLTPPP
jgi:hypothetical protein